MDIIPGVGVDHIFAFDADQVDVGFHVGLVARHLLERQFLNQATLLEHAQGGIDGGQGHGREMPFDPLINLLHGGMV